MSVELAYVRDVVAVHMGDILGEFQPGAKITVCVRTVGNSEADFLMTNDELIEVKALVERRIAADPDHG